MKTPYLVQRCVVKTRKPSEIVGIDSFLSYDYMGAAEFEFGRLGNNLRAILPTIDQYSIVSTDLKYQTREGIFLLCSKEQVEFASVWIGQEAIGNNKKLKEPTYLSDNLSGASIGHYNNFDLWWVLDHEMNGPCEAINSWFFCKGKETARLLFSALLKNKEKLFK